MNEFYWAIATTDTEYDDDGVPETVIDWLCLEGEFARVGIDGPNVQLFDTEEAAINYRDTYLNGQYIIRKIHRDFIYI